MAFNKFDSYLIEFLGTFFLVLTVGLNLEVDNNYTGITAPLAIGSILMCMIYMGGHISGAHYNPAITIGVFLRGNKIGLRDAIFYICSQTFAAFCASLCCFAITSVTFAPQPDADFSVLKTMMVEFFYSFALVFVVLSVATTKSLANNGFYGLAIGFTVTAGGYTTSGISGAAFNPALATGTMLVDLFTGWPYRIVYIWVYWIGGILGGCAAAGVFKIIYRNEEYNDNNDEN